MKLDLSTLTQDDAAIFVIVAASAIQECNNGAVSTISVGSAIEFSGVLDQPFEGITETPEFLNTELSKVEWWETISYLATRATAAKIPAPDPLLPRLSDPAKKNFSKPLDNRAYMP
ncbi:MAG TPA: hypothetical protein V6D27_01030 [Vampirovibrionales bacterium]